MSDAEEAIATIMCWAGLPTPIREMSWWLGRKYRFDFAWPDRFVALEVDGGSFVSGRHVRGVGFENDIVKLNEAAILGWKVLRCTPRQIADGHCLAWLERALA